MRQVHGLEKLSFERINYFFGQVLGLHDFRDAQAYFLDKARLHHLSLHGWGVVCGLGVTPVPPEADPCAPMPHAEHAGLRRRAADLEQQAAEVAASAAKLPAGQAQDELRKVVKTLEAQARALKALAARKTEGTEAPGRAARLEIGRGLAIDPQGRELLVATPLGVEIWRALSPHDRRTVEAGGEHTLWVSLCYAETPTRAVRPVTVDRCAPAGDQFARLRETTCVRISLTPPESMDRCDPCCEPATGECVLLARVDGYSLDEGLDGHAQVDEGVRRMLSLHDPVTVTSLSWKHGAAYPFDAFQRLLGRVDGQSAGKHGPGLAFTFSREIEAATIEAPGVFEVLRYGGGGAPAGDLQWIPFRMEQPEHERVRRVVFRQATDERWSPGDRLHIRLRCDFVLDACCLPVDGNHVGGRVPLAPDGIAPDEPKPTQDPKQDPKQQQPQAPYGSKQDPKQSAQQHGGHDHDDHDQHDDHDGHGHGHGHGRDHDGHDDDEPRCARSPFRPGAWRSGNGTPGGTFESWFYVTKKSAEAR